MSSGLFASVFKLCVYAVIQWARARQRFIRMSWGVGRGPSRFHTTLCLTDDTGVFVRFTHGLEMEIQLDVFARTLDQSTDARQETPGESPPEKRNVLEDTNTGTRKGHLDTYQCFPVNHNAPIPSRQLDIGQIVAHDTSYPACIARNNYSRTNQLSNGSPSFTPAPELTSEASVETTPDPSAYDGMDTDDQCVTVQINRQLLDEVLSRERRDAQLQFRIKGDMTAYRALLPPSMDGARSLGESGSPWVWSSDVRRWYWTDRNGQIWWH